MGMRLRESGRCAECSGTGEQSYSVPRAAQSKMFVEILALIGAAGLASVLLPLAFQCLTHRPQNLKRRYAAEWAVVTGGSSGIGRSLCHKLARQGISVVIVAVADTLLEETEKELRTAYPAVSIRAVGADLSRPGYLERVASATEDINVQLVFNNAGMRFPSHACWQSGLWSAIRPPSLARIGQASW